MLMQQSQPEIDVRTTLFPISTDRADLDPELPILTFKFGDRTYFCNFKANRKVSRKKAYLLAKKKASHEVRRFRWCCLKLGVRYDK